MLLAVAMLVCMVSISFSGDTANGKPKVEVIRLDGLVRDLPIQLRESWNAIGIDPNDNVYALFGGATDASSHGALFQFPGKDLLAALTVPNGDVMLYDPSGLTHFPW
jgi:hypothetical protein